MDNNCFYSERRQRMNEAYREKEIQEAIQRVFTKIDTVKEKLTVTAFVTKEPVTFSERECGVRKEVHPGEPWGELWDCAWLHVTGKRVPNWETLFLCLDVSGEGLVVTSEGIPVQGITTTQSTFDTSLGRPGKKYVKLSEIGSFENGIDIWVDCGCNDLFGNYVDSGCLKEAAVVSRDEQLKGLYYDLVFLKNLCGCIRDMSYQARIRQTLYEGAVLLKDEEESPEAVIQVKKQLHPFLNMHSRYPEDFKLSAVGHAHLDLAWLWPLRETKRKAVRTLSTALQMMKQYPDYVFGASQPQMFAWVKQMHPELYHLILKAVQTGRLECQGGMWVEADTNLSGGEALLRQFLYGKQFFKEEFGQEMKVLWLPDVFGYSAALPQMMKHMGVEYFMTIKLSWSEHNQFPYHTFLWQGIDGSEVLAHMPPEGTYNSSASPEALLKTEENYKEKHISDEALLLFGIGDGGGGPGEDHLESLKRAKTSVGVPLVVQQPAIRFFERLKAGLDRYPHWRGELYLEKHQGTYTTHAKNKRWNRKMEFALRECEFAYSLAKEYIEVSYPKQELEEIWKEVLLYQFHDILPGSSIQRVYQESQTRYESLYTQTEELTAIAYQALAEQISCKLDGSVLCFNSLPWEREEILETEHGFAKVTVPALGWAICETEQFQQLHTQMCEAVDLLENEKVRIQFFEDGSIASYYDKQAGRELVPPKEAMQRYVLYPDDGDCWDLPFGYRNHKLEPAKLHSVKAFRNEKEQWLEQSYTIGSSSFEVRISLANADKAAVISMKIDWNEQGKMLRVQFPLAIETDTASCEIQFGHVKRPMHRNTSWDQAKIEVSAHKWVDVSESGYGVAVLNDCKYGYNLWDQTIDLNLFRSPSYPSKEELGTHMVSYCILPHCGSLIESDVVQKGYEFNCPLVQRKIEEGQKRLPDRASLFALNQKNIVIEAVKQAEDGTGTILRLYESAGSRTQVKLTVGKEKQVNLVNGLEDNIEVLDVRNGEVNLTFSAFEIKTLKVHEKNGVLQ